MEWIKVNELHRMLYGQPVNYADGANYISQKPYEKQFISRIMHNCNFISYWVFATIEMKWL